MSELTDLILEGVTEEVANLQLPDPDLRDYYRDETQRIYWLDGEINEGTLDLVKFIMRCNKDDAGKPAEERKRILIMIDSPGGSVEVLGSIIGAIKISKTPVYTCCYCGAYSAAADLLACGHKRFALPMTNIMFHMGSCAYSGSQNDVDKAKKFFDRMGKNIVPIIDSYVSVLTSRFLPTNGTVSFSKLHIPAKALLWIVSTVSGTTSSLILQQPLNALVLISRTESGIVISVRLEQP